MNIEQARRSHNSEEGANHWTSFSDLFLVLTVVFLLLFVVANLKSGSATLLKNAEIIHAKAEIKELKKELARYENLVQNGASIEQIKRSREVISRLSLLEDKTDQERVAALNQAKLAEEKIKKLNQYQQIVKDLSDFNLVSAKAINNKDKVISQKEKTIFQKEKVISQKELEKEKLNGQVLQGQREATKTNRTIASLKVELDNMAEQQKKWMNKNQAISMEYKQQVVKLNSENIKKIENLKNQNTEKLQTLLSQNTEKLQTLQNQNKEKLHTLQSKNTEQLQTLKTETTQKLQTLEQKNKIYLAQLERSKVLLEHKNLQAKQLRDSLLQKRTAFLQRIAKLKLAHQEAVQLERQKLQRTLASVKEVNLSLKEEKNRNKEMGKKSKVYQTELNELNGELSKLQDSVSEGESKYQSAKASLAQANAALEKGLSGSDPAAYHEHVLIRKLQENFDKYGMGSSVNGKTGEVTISFGNVYFDTGKAILKPQMKQALEKMMPVYAESLFSDPELSKFISTVDIIGYASPTYKFQDIGPDIKSVKRKAALQYNLDLSYKRARAIFEYVFGNTKLRFKYQDAFLRLVKVSSRSYLEEDNLDFLKKKGAVSSQEFCKRVDCNKSQKAVIKFRINQTQE